MSKEEIKELLREFFIDYVILGKSNDGVYEKYTELLYKSIADLETKLAEMQNEKDELISKYRYWKGECAELKQQLAEKDANITYLTNQVKNM